MATFKIFVPLDARKKDGTYNVRMRVVCNRTNTKVSTPWFVTDKQIKKNGEIKDEKIKELCETFRRNYVEEYNSMCLPDNMTAKELVEAIQESITRKKEESKPWDLDFIDYIRQDEERLISNGQEGTASLRATMRRSFAAFVNKDSFPISEIKGSLLQRWIEWIPKQKYAKERKGRAQSLYITQMKAVYNRAKKEFNDDDMGIVRIPWNPFVKLDIPKQKVVEKRSLTLEQMRSIVSLQGKLSGRAELAVDIFLLSFYLIGMNAADLYTCTDYDGERLTYFRKKTASRRADNAKFSVLVPEEAKPIMEKYLDGGDHVFKFHKMYSCTRGFDKALSKGLDMIEGMIGAEHLQFYAARHTWATLAVNEAGVDKYTVHGALNHVDPNMAVTDMYIKKSWKPFDDANRMVIDYVLGIK